MRQLVHVSSGQVRIQHSGGQGGPIFAVVTTVHVEGGRDVYSVEYKKPNIPSKTYYSYDGAVEAATASAESYVTGKLWAILGPHVKKDSESWSC